MQGSFVAYPPVEKHGVIGNRRTAGLHGIHHGTGREEIGSNWSSGLSLWDRLHGTLRLDAPYAAVTIGLPTYRDPRELTLPKILAVPFGAQPPPFPTPACSATQICGPSRGAVPLSSPADHIR